MRNTKKEIAKLCGPVTSLQKLLGDQEKLKKYVDWCFEKKKDPDYWRKGGLTIYQVFGSNGKSMYNDFLGEKHSTTLGPSKNQNVLDRQNELGRYEETEVIRTPREQCYCDFSKMRMNGLKSIGGNGAVNEYFLKKRSAEIELFNAAIPEDMTTDQSEHYLNWFVNYLKESEKW